MRGVAMMCVMAAGAVVHAGTGDPSRIRMDTSQAVATLAILDRLAAGAPVQDSDWQALFSSTPYRRLQVREAAMKRDFTDEAFKAFVTGPGPVSQRAKLRDTLERWSAADLGAITARVVHYLPAGAAVRATVYPVIKPQSNSFVWDLDRDPAIFFYLDPSLTRAQFENMAAHELHHVGLASRQPHQQRRIASLPDGARLAAQWMGAFGEGLAMLAAAGSVETHPHAASPPDVRARWDRDLAHVEADLKRLDDFFLALVRGAIDERAAREQAMSFYGEQGPWYTVGYRMAVTVERKYGREALLRCIDDPRRLLATWNRLETTGARWSAELLSAVEARAADEP